MMSKMSKSIIVCVLAALTAACATARPPVDASRSLLEHLITHAAPPHPEGTLAIFPGFLPVSAPIHTRERREVHLALMKAKRQVHMPELAEQFKDGPLRREPERFAGIEMPSDRVIICEVDIDAGCEPKAAGPFFTRHYGPIFALEDGRFEVLVLYVGPNRVSAFVWLYWMEDGQWESFRKISSGYQTRIPDPRSAPIR